VAEELVVAFCVSFIETSHCYVGTELRLAKVVARALVFRIFNSSVIPKLRKLRATLSPSG